MKSEAELEARFKEIGFNPTTVPNAGAFNIAFYLAEGVLLVDTKRKRACVFTKTSPVKAAFDFLFK